MKMVYLLLYMLVYARRFNRTDWSHSMVKSQQICRVNYMVLEKRFCTEKKHFLQALA